MTDLGLNYFSKSEFKMGKVNVSDKMDMVFLLLLDELRGKVGQSLKINSSFRDKAYNDSIKGALKSKHLKGIAVDLACNNSTLRAAIVYHALDLGLTVGVGSTFVHVDNRNKQIMFTY